MAEKYNHQEEIKKLEAIKGKTLDEILKDAKERAGADVAKIVFKHFGIEMPNSVEAMFLVKGDRIEKNIVRKENAIVEAAIRRDSVMFSVAEFGNYIGDNREQKLKELHDKWLMYFETMYNK